MVKMPRPFSSSKGTAKSAVPISSSWSIVLVTSDGAVPVHFKAYDGNQTDDGIHLETWSRIRTLLQHPRFILRR